MSAEPTSSSGSSGRSRPALSDLSKETTEGDLWNLDDEPGEAPPPRVAQPPLPRQPAKIEALPEAAGTDVESIEPAAASAPDEGLSGPQAPKPRGKTPAQGRADHDGPLGSRSGRSPQSDEIGDLDEPRERLPHPAPAPAPQPEPAPAPQPAAAATPPVTSSGSTTAPAIPRPRIHRRDAINLAAFAFVLLLAAIWVLTRFFSLFEFKSQFVEMPDFPLKGQHASIGGADTFWREPVRSGEQRDFARREVAMIPVLELTLDPASSAGALLVIFRNGQGEPVGDAIRRSFRDGRFDASGNATITFPATDGFVEEGNYHAYRTGKGDPWMAEVLEGPSVDAPAGDFRPLAPIPVSPLRR
jgi:hypothetical protein